MEILFKEAAFRSWINTLVGSKKNNATSNDLAEVLKNRGLSASAIQDLQDCQNKRVKKIEEEWKIERFERIDSNKKKPSTLIGKKIETDRNNSIKKGKTPREEDMEIGNR